MGNNGKTLVGWIKEEFAMVTEKSDRSLNLSLLFACIMLFVYCYFGSFSFYEKAFAGTPEVGYWRIIYHHCTFFALMFVLGLVFIKLVLRRSPKDYGLAFGHKKLSVILILIGIPMAALSGLTSETDEQLTATYPLIDLNMYRTWQYVLGYYVSYFLYYIGWEFLFRGLLLNASKKAMGVVGAILFTTMISALIHTSIAAFGKPMIETLSAIPAGIIFGYIAHKTQSIYPTLIIHAMIGFFTDWFIFFL